MSHLYTGKEGCGDPNMNSWCVKKKIGNEVALSCIYAQLIEIVALKYLNTIMKILEGCTVSTLAQAHSTSSISRI